MELYCLRWQYALFRIAMLRIAMDPKKDARMMLLFRWHNGRKQFIKEKALYIM